MNDYTECSLYYDDYRYMTAEEVFDFMYGNDNDLFREEEENNMNKFDDFDLSFTPEDLSNEDFDLIIAELSNELNDC